MNDDHNVIPFPAERSARSAPSREYSQLFLAVLLKNISDTYHFDHQYAATRLVPYLPGLHSLTEAVIQRLQSQPQQSRLANELLAEAVVNSFRAAGLIRAG